MKKCLVGLIILLLMFTTSCKEPTNEEIFYEMQKTLNNMDSYACTAKITITGNKSPESHVAKHVFKKPNMYIIEVLEPKETEGKITLFDGSQSWLYHPQIDQSMIIRDFKGSVEESLFMGYFLRIFMTTEETKIESETIDNKDYLVLTAKIPGNNKYRHEEKLWIGKKDFIPYKLTVFDINNKEAVDVIYSEFNYDIEIDDDKFNIEASKEILKEL